MQAERVQAGPAQAASTQAAAHGGAGPTGRTRTCRAHAGRAARHAGSPSDAVRLGLASVLRRSWRGRCGRGRSRASTAREPGGRGHGEAEAQERPGRVRRVDGEGVVDGPPRPRGDVGGQVGEGEGRPRATATPRSAPPSAVPRAVARRPGGVVSRGGCHRRPARAPRPGARTREFQHAETLPERDQFPALRTLTSLCATGMRWANGTSSAASRSLSCRVTGARSTVTASSRSPRRARRTASCAARFAVSQAVRKAAVPVKDPAASCMKCRTSPSSGPASTSRHDPVGDRVRERLPYRGVGGQRCHGGHVPPGVADLVLRPRGQPAHRHEQTGEHGQYGRQDLSDEDRPNTDFPITDSVHSSRKNPAVPESIGARPG